MYKLPTYSVAKTQDWMVALVTEVSLKLIGSKMPVDSDIPTLPFAAISLTHFSSLFPLPRIALFETEANSKDVCAAEFCGTPFAQK